MVSCIRDLASAIQQEKKIIKGKQVKKEESLYLFVENIIIYIGNPEKITKGN